MKTRLIAAAVALMALSTPLAAAQAAASGAPQARPYSAQSSHDDHNDRNDRSDRNDRGGRNDDRYGRWDNSWGARPAAPPRHFTRTNDWYRHVRACQQRYRSYNPATDRYTVRRGQTAICRL